MSEPADKSDDLIAELAKLMAVPPGGGSKPAAPPAAAPQPVPVAQAVPRPVPAAPMAPMSGVPPIRIPGMDPPAPKPAPVPQPAAAAPAQPVEAQRAPITGSIRIPGMDQPAPVSTSAPVGKFDFAGRSPVAIPSRPEPIASLSDRLAAGQASIAHDTAPRAEAPAPAPVRIPSDLRPVSENRSFGEGPSLGVTRPAPAPAPAPVAAPVAASAAPAAPVARAPAGNFSFDFGFGNAAPDVPSAGDPIAALIEADMAEGEAAAEVHDAGEEDSEAPPAAGPARPAMATVTPINRSAQPAGRPAMAPISQAAPRNAANAPIPLKPVSVAPRPPESDRFAISPGVGLTGRPPSSQPLRPQPSARSAGPAPQLQDDSDPMSEIESLIGEAVRVELSPGPVRVQSPQVISPRVQFEPDADVEAEIRNKPEPAPVVPPLTTQFAPRRANLKDEGTNSAEAAILAAAAASGAQVGRVEPAVGDESPYRRLKVKPQKERGSSSVRQYIGMAVAGTLLLAAGLGLYWVLNMGRIATTTGANAPQLTADATPVKVAPPPVVKANTDSAKSPVLAKMDGATSAPSSEQLVSTDQSATTNVTRDVTPVAGATADPNGDPGLANRKVRTVTVRPDGTIVPGDDALAGGAELSVDRPNVPAVPTAEQPVNLLGADTAVAEADPLATASTAPMALAEPTTGPAAAPALTSPTAADATNQVAEVQPVIDPTAVAPKPMSFPAKTTKPKAAAPQTAAAEPTNTSVNAVITGAQTPNGQIDLLGGGNTTAAKPPATVAKTTPAPAASTPAVAAAAYVQIASQPNQADANASAKLAAAKYGALFNGRKLLVQSADLGQKGVRYRVRLPASSLTEANSICAQIKAQGGDCFATNG